MSPSAEFHYRLPRKLGAWRAGSHPATTLGAGQEFASHANLYDRPDPRRLDLRASLRSLRGEWLVRVNRQRAAVPVYVIVDVSASMAFGSPRPKLQRVADFVEALGRSAFAVGDALGMAAFDEHERMDLLVPALLSRGTGTLMATLLRASVARGRGADGLVEAIQRHAGRAELIFLVSDFHWPLERLEPVLDLLSHAFVVPMVVWDHAEIAPPEQPGLLSIWDMESQTQRMLWMRPKLRQRWLEAVARRRWEIADRFARRNIRPFHVEGEFDGEAMSRYFLEAGA
jgi:uncharacterized protein (DUF58 family)